MDHTLLSFAREVQKRSHIIMASATMEHADATGGYTALLCDLAADVIRSIDMNREQADVQTLDLGELAKMPHGKAPEPFDSREEQP